MPRGGCGVRGVGLGRSYGTFGGSYAAGLPRPAAGMWWADGGFSADGGPNVRGRSKDVVSAFGDGLKMGCCAVSASAVDMDGGDTGGGNAGGGDTGVWGAGGAGPAGRLMGCRAVSASAADMDGGDTGGGNTGVWGAGGAGGAGLAGG
jgi:hypothetical protein